MLGGGEKRKVSGRKGNEGVEEREAVVDVDKERSGRRGRNRCMMKEDAGGGCGEESGGGGDSEGK